MSIVKAPPKKNIKRSSHIRGFSELPTILSVTFDDDKVSFYLSDKRIITIPLHWIPKLEKAGQSTRENYKLSGHFIFWEEVDEIIGVKNLLNGTIVPNES
ncbi:MAG TPA: DUF2442 domain-containing protein [Prolixibacteraceae bacterium]|nr:DUF2442 domain-containing protein [Prolixibacteraceae bacterium]